MILLVTPHLPGVSAWIQFTARDSGLSSNIITITLLGLPGAEGKYIIIYTKMHHRSHEVTNLSWVI